MRIFYLDAARSVLMSLGVVLHTAAMYDPLLKWALTDPKGNAVFHVLRVAIHVFRMPAFFMLSGFFCLMVLGKYGNRFLQTRLTRIIVPLAATAVLLNTVQAYVLYEYHDSAASFWAYYAAGEDLLGLFHSGRWISHLWFLVNLAIYTVVAYAGYRLALRHEGKVDAALDRLAPVFEHRASLFVLPALAMVPWAVAYKVHGMVYLVLGFLDLADLMHYGLFFALGMVMYRRPNVLQRFSQAGWHTAAAVAVSIGGLWALESMPPSTAHTLAEYYLSTLLSLSVAVLVLNLFKRFASQPNKVFAYLSEASYTVYLFHHLTVILIGIALMSLPINAYLKFPIVVVCTFTIVLGIHHFLVLRFRPLRFLFNGKYASAEPLAQPAARVRTTA